MNRRNKRNKKKRRRRIFKKRAKEEESRNPASPDVKRKLFHSLKYLYGVFPLSFVVGYLGPVLLAPAFSKYFDSAVFGTLAGTGCSILVFGLLHRILTQDHESAEDLIDAIEVGQFTHIHAGLFGSILGTSSGLVYPITAWIRPFTGGKSIDDIYGHFLWAPIGALMAFVLATTWCFSRRASLKSSDSRLSRLKIQIWRAGVTIALGFWLLCTVADLFPRHRSGIDLKAPHAWISILPLFVIIGGIGSALTLGATQTRVTQAVNDRKRSSMDDLTEPIETFASTHGMRRLAVLAPNWIRIVPTGGMQIAGWLFMGCAFFVYALVVAIALWAPHISNGAEFPLLIVTPFLLIGLSFITVPLRFTFDGNQKVIWRGNFWRSRKIAFDEIEAVQTIDTDGWQLNLITKNPNERRIHVWDHDIESTRYAADCLAALLKVDVLHIEQ